MAKGTVLPAKYLVKVAERTGHSIDWLLTGDEATGCHAADMDEKDSIISEVSEYMKPFLPDARKMVRDIVKRIAEEEKSRGK